MIWSGATNGGITPNGAVGVARAVIAARDPWPLGELFTRMFGEDSVRQSATGCSLTIGLSQFDIVTPPVLHMNSAMPHLRPMVVTSTWRR